MFSKHFPRKVLASVIAAASINQSIPVVYAQGALEEIIVSARKRAETVQDVPIAITAFSGEMLEQSGYTELQNLNEGVPNLEFSGGNNVAQIYVRGVGQRDASPLLDPGVGVYMDGIYIARPDGQMLDTVDVTNVQVLRGPQGTLFGKNNIGGALLIELAKPENEFSGYVEGRLGNYDRRDGKLVVNAPLIEDKLLSRVTLSSRKRDGYMENIDSGQDASDQDRMMGVLQLSWLINDESTVDVLAAVGKTAEMFVGSNCVATDLSAAIPANFVIPQNPSLTALSEACERSSELLEDDKVDDTVDAYNLDTQLLGITYTLDAEYGTFKSISSWSEQKVDAGEVDNDNTALPFSGKIPVGDSIREQFSQEFQFTGSALDETLDYTVGVFAQHENVNEAEIENIRGYGMVGLQGQDVIDGIAAGFGPGAALLPGFSTVQGTGQNIFVIPGATVNFPAVNNNFDLENETYAAFGQVSYDLTDWIEITVGARYTVEKRESTFDRLSISATDSFILASSSQLYGATSFDPDDFSAFGLGNGPTPAFFFMNGEQFTNFYNAEIGSLDNLYALTDPFTDSQEEQWEELTPMMSLQFTAPDDLAESLGLDAATSYFSYSSGFKSGGFQLLPTRVRGFDPETVDNFEIGIKLDALDRTLRFNSAIFYMEYDDIQYRTATASESGVPGEVEVGVTNAGSATIQGLELELTWAPLDSLQIIATAGFLDAELNEFDELVEGGGVLDRSDESFQEVPDKTFSLALVHTADFEFGSLLSRVDTYYRDEIYVGIDDGTWDQRELATLDSYQVFNARVAWESPDETWQVALWGKNLTDEEYFEGKFAALDTVGVSVKHRSPPRMYGIEAKYSF